MSLGMLTFSGVCTANNALHHCLMAIYSASVELTDIMVFCLLDQWIDTPAKAMINPVRDHCLFWSLGVLYFLESLSQIYYVGVSQS
jgi:hypothetical protein